MEKNKIIKTDKKKIINGAKLIHDHHTPADTCCFVGTKKECEEFLQQLKRMRILYGNKK